MDNLDMEELLDVEPIAENPAPEEAESDSKHQESK